MLLFLVVFWLCLVSLVVSAFFGVFVVFALVLPVSICSLASATVGALTYHLYGAPGAVDWEGSASRSFSCFILLHAPVLIHSVSFA